MIKFKPEYFQFMVKSNAFWWQTKMSPQDADADQKLKSFRAFNSNANTLLLRCANIEE